jgi:hypothetical protein
MTSLLIATSRLHRLPAPSGRSSKCKQTLSESRGLRGPPVRRGT